jgi:hypothetical protein
MKRLAIWTILLLIAASVGGAAGRSSASSAAAANTYWGDGVQAILPAHAATGADRVVSISSVSCASAGNCSAVGSYRNEAGRPEGLLLTETDGFWGSGVEAVLPPNAAVGDQLVDLNSVSCASAGNCSAVGTYYDSSGAEGLLLTETDGTWATGLEAALPANAVATGRETGLNSVSCTSAGNCTAVGSYSDGSDAEAALVIRETAGTWETGVEAALPANASATGQAAGLRSVSCSSAGNCSAVGSYLDNSGQGPGMLLTETARTWGTGVEASLPANGANTQQFVDLTSISCASAGNCGAVGTYNNDTNSNDGVLLTETAGTWTTGVKAALPPNGAKDDQVDLNAVSCPSAASCAAVGDYVDHSGNIRGLLLTQTAGVWSNGLEAALPANATSAAPNQLNGLNSVSCASPGNCSAVGSYRDKSDTPEGLMVNEISGSWTTGVEAVMRKHAPYVAGYLTSVSCSSAEYCSAVGGFEQSKGALFSSSPTPPCLVPTLKGRPLRVAKHAIEAYDCSVGKIKRATSRSVKRGRVISQRPRAGTRLDRGARINLVVSKGRRR